MRLVESLRQKAERESAARAAAASARAAGGGSGSGDGEGSDGEGAPRLWREAVDASVLDKASRERRARLKRRAATPGGVPRLWRDRTGTYGGSGGGAAGADHGRRLRLAGLTLVMTFGLMGLIWVASWFWPPRPSCLILLGAGYEENLQISPNTAGVRGLEAIVAGTADPDNNAAAFFNRRRKLRLQGSPTIVRTSTRWDAGLEERIPEPVIVLVIAMHGDADAYGPFFRMHDGEPCTAFPLAADALKSDDKSAKKSIEDRVKAEDARTGRLRFATVMERIGELPAGKKVFLILDATSDTGRGPDPKAQNDFARAMTEWEPRIAANPQLCVLMAGGINQRSWIREDRGITVFLDATARGLAGGAVGPDGGSLTALALYRYVDRVVTRWSVRYRNAVQEPVLLPSGPDGEARAAGMELTMIAPRTATPAAEESSPAVAVVGETSASEEIYGEQDGDLGVEFPRFSPPDWSADAEREWRWYEYLSKTGMSPASFAPRLWVTYREVLLRWDELTRIGASERVRTELAARLLELREEMGRLRRAPLNAGSTGLSLPLLEGLTPEESGLPDVAERERIFDQFWDETKKPAERSEAWERTLAQADFQAGRVWLRQDLWARMIARIQSDPARWLEPAADLTRRLTDPNLPRPVELQSILMLERTLRALSSGRPLAGRWSPAFVSAVGDAVTAERAAQEAFLGRRLTDALIGDSPGLAASNLTLGDQERRARRRHARVEEIHPWVTLHPDWRDLDVLRRQGWDALPDPRPSSRGEAQVLFQRVQAAALRVADFGDLVRDAAATRDDVFTLLPGLTRWWSERLATLPRTDEAADADVVAFETLWRLSYALADRLAQGPGRNAGGKAVASEDIDILDEGAKLRVLAEEVRRGLAVWTERYRRDVEDAAESPFPKDILMSDTALLMPWPSADLRKNLWETARLAVANGGANADAAAAEAANATEAEKAAAFDAAQPKSGPNLARRRAVLLLASRGADLDADAQGYAEEDVKKTKIVTDEDEDDWATWRSELALVGRAVDAKAGVGERRPWWRTLRLLPSRTAARESARFQRIRTLMKEASATPDRDRTRALWTEVSRRLRRLHPPLVALLNGDDDPDPALRRAAIADVMFQQAIRLWNDHWWTDQIGAAPYFQQAASACLDDVVRTSPFSESVPNEQLSAWMDRIARTPAFGFNPPRGDIFTQQDPAAPSDSTSSASSSAALLAPWTSERERSLALTLQVDPSPTRRPPPGRVLAWVNPGRDLQIGNAGNVANENTNIRENSEISPRLLDNGSGWKPGASLPGFLTQLQLRPDLAPVLSPTPRRTGLTASGAFRGRTWSLPIRWDLALLPDVTQQLAPLGPGGVSLSAPVGLLRQSGRSEAALVIVLDASGSMGGPVVAGAGGAGNSPDAGGAVGNLTSGERDGRERGAGEEGGENRYRQSLKALRGILSRLRPGVTVSIWVFGAGAGTLKTVDPPERTIQNVLRPTVWDAQNVAPMEELMGRLEKLEPWNRSPLTRTMLQAGEQLRGFRGAKTLLVITDGLDNRFEDDRVANPRKETSGEALRVAFGAPGAVAGGSEPDPGIEVIVIGFQVPGRERAPFREQFAAVEQFPTPGKLVNIDKADDLAFFVEKSLKPRLRYDIQPAGATWTNSWPAKGRDVAQGETDGPFPSPLPPGSYQLRVLADRVFDTTFIIDPGDRLRFRLEAEPEQASSTASSSSSPSPSSSSSSSSSGRIRVVRRPWASDELSTRPAREGNGYRLTVVRNNQRDDGGLDLMTALESDPRGDQPGAALRLGRVGRVWYEVAPAPDADLGEDPALFAVKSYRVEGYPAVTHALEIPYWPSAPVRTGVGRAIAPGVTAWFDPDRGFSPGDRILRHAEGRWDWPRTGRLSGRDAVIEDARVETHDVRIAPGVIAPQPCLVVRARYPIGHPIWVEPVGINTFGAEHRYYRTVGRYTGLFWPVADDVLERKALAGGDGASAGASSGAGGCVAMDVFGVEEFQAYAQRNGRQLSLPYAGQPRPRDPLPDLP